MLLILLDNNNVLRFVFKYIYRTKDAMPRLEHKYATFAQNQVAKCQAYGH